MRERTRDFFLTRTQVDDKKIYDYVVSKFVCDTLNEFLEIFNKQLDVVMDLYSKDTKYPKKDVLTIQFEIADNNVFINRKPIEDYLYLHFTRHFSKYTKFEIEVFKLVDIFYNRYTYPKSGVNILERTKKSIIKDGVKNYKLNYIFNSEISGNINGLKLEIEKGDK